MTKTKYFFIPWLKQGLSSQITIDNGAVVADTQRASTDVKLKIKEKVGLINKTIQLYGPGDIVSFDASIIVRTDPKNDVGDFEPNYFPMIEFWEEDFPWLMTPARSVDEKLHPWVTLIVLRAEKITQQNEDGETELESEYEETSDPTRPCPFITIKNQNSSLPDPAELWRWAHVQVTTEIEELPDNEIEFSIEDIKNIISNYPERVISRITCPRRLQPGVLYNAFLVPTFETGRKAGLGMPPTGTALLAPAWDINSQDPIDLPYYFRWEFRTGLRGDFEYLVRLLEARPLDNRVGKRDIDCTDPGLGISADPGNLPYKLGLEGALKHLRGTTDPCTPEYKEQIRSLINQNEGITVDLSDPSSRPKILPEIYAKYHALIDQIEDDNSNWIKELNLGPRNRATAGFGSEVIRTDQEHLMHEAWRQVGAIEEANQKIKEAQMASLINEKLLKKKLSALPENTLIQLTAPLHSKIRIASTISNEQGTIKGYLKNTKLPMVVFDPSFRRTARKRGILRNRQNEDVKKDRKDLLARMNDGEVQGAGPAKLPDSIGSINEVSESFRPIWAKGWLWKMVKYLPLVLLIASLLLWVILLILHLVGTTINFAHPLLLSIQGIVVGIIAVLTRLSRAGRIADSVQESAITPEFINRVRPPRDFPEPENFRQFARAIQFFLHHKPTDLPDPAPANLPALHDHLIGQLNPAVNLIRKLYSRFISPGLNVDSSEIVPVMAHPEFSNPMYEPLAELSQDYLLPGLEYIQQNTITLLQTNQAFVEAYMTGCNVEFAGELLWREYPTDLRCTCFRQFWDISEVIRPRYIENRLEAEVLEEKSEEIAAFGDEEQDEKEAFIGEHIQEKWKEMLLDIKPIHRWTDASLGQNRSVYDPDLEDKLVLLIRGDVLKKYPNTTIYAVKAYWTVEDGIDVRRPIFSQIENDEEITSPDAVTLELPVLKGTLKPDITFLGFNFTEEQVRGNTIRYTTNDNGETEQTDPGWFFVIEERVSESRFGMDSFLVNDDIPVITEVWDDLSWGHFYDQDDEGNRIYILSDANYIDAAEPRHNVPTVGSDELPTPIIWGKNAAHMSHITLQKPVRIAVHADDMLPEPLSDETEGG